MKRALLLPALVVALLQSCAACDPPPGPPDPEDAGPEEPVLPPVGPGFDAGPPPDFATSTRGRVVWKRYRALEQDLQYVVLVSALALCVSLSLSLSLDLSLLTYLS